MPLSAIIRADFNLSAPWQLKDLEFIHTQQHLIIILDVDPVCELECPICGAKSLRQSTKARTWRHLNFMEYTTIVNADVPIVHCPVHGLQELATPWAENEALGTFKFEEMVLRSTPLNNAELAQHIFMVNSDELDLMRKRAAIRRHRDIV